VKFLTMSVLLALASGKMMIMLLNGLVALTKSMECGAMHNA